MRMSSVCRWWIGVFGEDTNLGLVHVDDDDASSPVVVSSTNRKEVKDEVRVLW